MAQRHEIPTHLAVEDRVLGGLTMPQLLVLLGGMCTSYALWQGCPAVLAPVRPALAGSALAGGMAIALLRPRGRGLLTWTLVVGRYLLMPRLYLWRACHAATVDTGADEHWLNGAPRLAWSRAGAPPTQKGQMP